MAKADGVSLTEQANDAEKAQGLDSPGAGTLNAVEAKTAGPPPRNTGGNPTFKLMSEDGSDIGDIMSVGDDDGGMSTVVIKEAVYEEHDLPGTDRKGTRMLYAKGQRVPTSELAGLKAQVAQHKESSGSAETK